MSLKVLTLAAEGHTELPIHPYGIGAIVLGLLLAALAVLLVVGRGRDHS
jgi:hypothetical protein